MALERGRGKGKAGTFFAGFFSGMLFLTILGLAGGLYLISNPPAAAVKAANAGVSRVVSRVTKSMPREYLARNQDEIADLLSRFVKAYSSGRITAEDMDVITQKGFEYSADQKITEAEIQQMLQLIESYTDKK